MSEVLSLFIVSFSAVFVVVDPVGIIPIYLSITKNKNREDVQSIALKACVVSCAILSFFALFGSLIFKLLHLELNSFRIAGGILLLLTSLDMLRARMPETKYTEEEGEEDSHRTQIAIVPLSIPLLAGPGAMTTVMVLMAQGKTMFTAIPVLFSIIVTFILSFYIFKSANHIQKFLGSSGSLILERVMGLILAAIAVQFLADGGRALLGIT